MGPLKKHLTAIGKGGITVHKGKGASPFPAQPKPGPLTMGAPSANNYAKATPLAAPASPGPALPTGISSPGMDSSPGQSQGMV